MKFLYKNLTAFEVRGLGYFAEVRTDGEKLYVSVYNTDRTIHDVSGIVRYNGEERFFSHTSSPEEIIFFDYAEDVKTLSVTIDGSRLDCSWHGSFSDPAPEVAVTYTGIRSNSDFEASFVYSGDGENCALVAPIITYLSAGTWQTLYYTPSKHTDTTFSKHIFAGMNPGTPYRVTLLFACYADPTDELENYIGLAEYTLPQFVLTAEGTPFAPNGLTYAPEIAGVPSAVTWNPVNDPEFDDVAYVVTRHINRGTGSVVYRGTDTTFDDTLPGGTVNVSYSVKTVSGQVESAEYDGEEVPITSSNVFIGIDGRPIPATAVYIGKNGVPCLASPTLFVG